MYRIVFLWLLRIILLVGISALLEAQTGSVIIKQPSPRIHLEDTSLVSPAGLWRFLSYQDQFRLQKATAANFATTLTPLCVNVSGKMGIGACPVGQTILTLRQLAGQSGAYLELRDGTDTVGLVIDNNMDLNGFHIATTGAAQVAGNDCATTGIKTAAITFDRPFVAVPKVLLSLSDVSQSAAIIDTVYASNVTITGFTASARVSTAVATCTFTFTYVALGN